MTRASIKIEPIDQVTLSKYLQGIEQQIAKLENELKQLKYVIRDVPLNLYDEECEVVKKKTGFKNIGEQIVWVLGETGIKETPIYTGEVNEICTEKLGISEQYAKSARSKCKHYFVKDDDLMCTFSKKGELKYNDLKKRHNTKKESA